MAAPLLLVQQSIEGQGFVQFLIVAWVWLVAMFYPGTVLCGTGSYQLAKPRALTGIRLWYQNLLGVPLAGQSIRWLLVSCVSPAASPAGDHHGLSKLSLAKS